MRTQPHPWPKGLPRVFKPLARLADPPGFYIDCLARAHALRVEQEWSRLQCSGLTQTYGECFFANRTDYTAFNTSSSEGSILAGGGNLQPVIPALYLGSPTSAAKALTFEASGVLGTTGTPTIIFQARLGTTLGSAYLSGTSVGVTAAITTSSGVTNKFWYMRLDLTCTAPGLGSTNCTLAGAGFVSCPGGFASPFVYAIEPTTPDTATWTATLDGALTQYLNISATWSASSSSNTITCKNLRAFAWN